MISDATFMWKTDVDWLHGLCAKHGAELIQVWLTANQKITRERFVARAHGARHPGHNDSLESVVEEFDRRFFSVPYHEPLSINGKTKIVDTTDFNTVDHDSILKFVLDD